MGGGFFNILSPGTRALVMFGASGAVPVFVLGSWWTVLSATWLHGGLLHIVFNMMWVRNIGPSTADVIGPARTVIIYVVSGVCGFLLSSVAGAYFPPIPLLHGASLTVGASASIFAAALSSEPTLKTFLTKRADALLSNDYYDSDVAWMELKGAVEPTIGPYEVYEDEFFNYKAAFESFITIQDEEESAKIQKFSGQLQEIENRLPIDPKYRNPKIAGMAPLVVVDEIFAAGDANRGVQTAAYNLPNDERVLKEKGAKRVMLKNVQDAKFAKTLVPISKVVLDTTDQRSIAFDAFFSQIVVHEMMHGLGPHNITVGGRETTVRKEMKEASSFLEEAKADISSLYALQFMIDKGVLPKTLQDTLYTTFLASCFRSIRFGIAEAHGKGIAVQLNYLLDQGALRREA